MCKLFIYSLVLSNAQYRETVQANVLLLVLLWLDVLVVATLFHIFIVVCFTANVRKTINTQK